MDAEKRKRYENIAAELTRLAAAEIISLESHTVRPVCVLCLRIMIRQIFMPLKMWTL